MNIDDEQLQTLIARVVAGEASAQERSGLETLAGADPAVALAWRQTQALWDRAGAVPETDAEAEVNVDAAWASLSKRIAQPKAAPRQNVRQAHRSEPPLTVGYKTRPGRQMRLGLMAAATLLLTLAGYLIWMPGNRTPDTPVLASRQAGGQDLAFAMADGSQVRLKGGGSLRYDSTRFATQRHLYLDGGMGYFEVAKRQGRRFTVEAGSARVVVLGTRFTVRNAGGQTQVSVLEGRVRVIRRRGGAGLDSVELTPGQGALVTETALRREVAAPAATAWASGELRLEAEPLAEVCRLLTEVYGRPVALRDPALSERRVSAVFRQKSLDAVLAALSELYALQVVPEGDTLFLKPKN